MPSPAIAVIAAALLVALAPEARAQGAGSGSEAGQGLTVVRCDPAANTCDEQGPRFTMPVLGPSGQSTVLSPNMRSTELSLDADDYRILIPGCTPAGAGVFVCESLHQYQHCRTMMFSRMVHSCRAPNPFADGLVEARPAAPGEYALEIDSNARVRVARGDRSFGQTRGSASVELRLDVPSEVPGGACLQRDLLLYRPTGPEGGVTEVEPTDTCEVEMEFDFGPHDDDILRAHDLCESFAAWGGEIEDSMEIIAAGLFHMRSADSGFVARYESGVGIIAPYLSISAPLEIRCDE